MRAHEKTGETGQQMNEPVNQFQIKDPNKFSCDFTLN